MHPKRVDACSVKLVAPTNKKKKSALDSFQVTRSLKNSEAQTGGQGKGFCVTREIMS